MECVQTHSHTHININFILTANHVDELIGKMKCIISMVNKSFQFFLQTWGKINCTCKIGNRSILVSIFALSTSHCTVALLFTLEYRSDI